MPKRRIHGEGSYAHYVTFSCYKRRRFLDPDKCKRIAIGRMGSQLAHQDGLCAGFVVMPDHVHAAIWFPREFQISLFINKWKELSSREIHRLFLRQFPKYLEKVGGERTIWQPKYYDFNIYSDRKLREKVDYMHNNPVRAGLVREATEWPWSSARFWLLGKPVGIPISWPP